MVQVAASGGSSSTIVVDVTPVQQAGQKITQDAQDLQTKVAKEWTLYEVETSAAPALCVINDLNAFRSQQEPLAKKAIDNRITIGQTLAKSATLMEFQDAVTAKSFAGPNIYAGNPYYPSSDNTNPSSLQRPSGFAPHYS